MSYKSLHSQAIKASIQDNIVYLDFYSIPFNFSPTGKNIIVQYKCQECGGVSELNFSEEYYNVLVPYFEDNFPEPLGLAINDTIPKRLFAIRNMLCEKCVIKHDYNRYVLDKPTYIGKDVMLNSTGLTEHYDGIIEGYSSEIADAEDHLFLDRLAAQEQADIDRWNNILEKNNDPSIMPMGF